MYSLFLEGVLTVHPANVITFIKEGTELVSTVELQNNDPTVNLTYKVFTGVCNKLSLYFLLLFFIR